MFSFSRVALYASLFVALSSLPLAHASITVLVGEPFGPFGTYVPVGHSTIFLDHVCADGPLRLRMCRPGEPAGVAISRYDHIGPYDWLATPILQFLYATNSAQDVPNSATPELAESLRRQYRERYLAALFPDGTETTKPDSEWWESVGMAYTRRLWGYQLATTTQQDAQFVAAINARANRHNYHVRGGNCADFAANALNFFYPGMVRPNHFADLGVMLPKQVARSVYVYGVAHPEAALKIIEIPQVPGTIRRSHAIRGGAESFLKTRRYILPLSILQPEIAVTLVALYFDHGGWKIARPASILTPETIGTSPHVRITGN